MSLRAFYDTQEFRDDWYSTTPLRVLSDRYGVGISAIRRAAMRRGLTPRLFIRPRTCKEPGCDLPKFCRGYCVKHYYRAKKVGFENDNT